MVYGMTPDMLARMYVSGSLKNQGDGFTFEVQNKIDSGAVSGLTKLIVDDAERPLEGATVELGGQARPVTEISWSNSLYVPYGAKLKLYVPGQLEPGQHTIKLTVNTPEVGPLTISITDTVS